MVCPQDAEKLIPAYMQVPQPGLKHEVQFPAPYARLVLTFLLNHLDNLCGSGIASCLCPACPVIFLPADAEQFTKRTFGHPFYRFVFFDCPAEEFFLMSILNSFSAMSIIISKNATLWSRISSS